MDQADYTTDTEDDLADGWDNNNEDNFDPDVEMKNIEMVQRDHHMSRSP
jgi:hypothetical protein